MLLIVAWRNIWRNKRRTAVVLTAVAIGVWSMIFLGALMRGVAVQLVNNGISTLTGHVQIHAKGYREDPSVDSSIENPQEVIDALEKILPPESVWSYRIRVPAVVSNARHSAGITLVGVVPEREAKVSFIGRAIKEGEYLREGDLNGAVVGRELAKLFGTRVGKKLVLMAQDSRGDLASRAFRIRGIFAADLASTEKKFLFVNIRSAREMLKVNGAVSEFSVVLPDDDYTLRVRDSLRRVLPPDEYDVESWRELLPLTVAITEMYDFFIYLWYVVVFIAMAFGIVNTTLMVVFERVKEFGLMQALGMKPWWIIRGVLLESLMIISLGTLFGNVLGVATVDLLSRTGIDLAAFAAGAEYFGLPRVIYPVLSVSDFIVGNSVVLVLGLAVSIYPAWKATRFTPVEAMRSV